jgi:cytochrome c2
MKTLTTAIAVTLLTASAWGQDAAAGRQAFARCGNCHVPPDLTTRADLSWLESINGSA